MGLANLMTTTDRGQIMNEVEQSAAAASQAPSTKDLMRFEAEKKSAGTALFLCWLLGSCGAHRFYLGRTGTAVTMLAITLISIPLSFVFVGFIGLFIVGVWVIVDLFSVSRWAREYNGALLARIQSGQG